MKKLAVLTVLCALLLSVAPWAAAADNSASDWAKAEVDKAVSLDFVAPELQGDYQKNITRAEFAKTAELFVAMQFNVDWFKIDYFYAQAYPDWFKQRPTTPLTDTNDIYVTSAYNHGIVNGRGNGIFDPDAPITRQEAAKMLMNTYRFYSAMAASDQNGGNPTGTLSDASAIADWAAQDVGTLLGWQVMQGIGGNQFDPLGYYTREQCLSTFIRLYEKAPKSRYYGKALCPVSYDQLYDETKNPQLNGLPLSFKVLQEYDTPLCSVLYTCLGGTPHGASYALTILYKDGGMRDIYSAMPRDPGVPPLTNSMLDNLKLSDDQKTLTFTCGGRDYAVDLATGKVTVVSPSA